jgi:hypothetical protein
MAGPLTTGESQTYRHLTLDARRRVAVGIVHYQNTLGQGLLVSTTVLRGPLVNPQKDLSDRRKGISAYQQQDLLTTTLAPIVAGNPFKPNRTESASSINRIYSDTSSGTSVLLRNLVTYSPFVNSTSNGLAINRTLVDTTQESPLALLTPTNTGTVVAPFSNGQSSTVALVRTLQDTSVNRNILLYGDQTPPVVNTPFVFVPKVNTVVNTTQSSAYSLLNVPIQVPFVNISTVGVLTRPREGMVDFYQTVLFRNVTYVLSAGGSIIFSGSSSQLKTDVIEPTGTLTFSGSAAGIKTDVIEPTGLITFSGTAPISFLPIGGTQTPYLPLTGAGHT